MQTFPPLSRRRILAYGAASLLALAGCGVKHAGGFAALVLDMGGPDDHSFNEGAVHGLRMGRQKLNLPKSQTKWVESNSPSDYQPNLTALASAPYQVVFAIGYAMFSALKEVAPRYPKVKFAIVDDDAPPFPNCEGLTFKEQEGSFLAGYLAASVSKTKKIGFVGGQQIPLIEKFQAGYTAGAKTADPAVVVTATYTGDWNDETKGRSQAAQQFNAGDDIIYQAAGKAGLGVIEEAKARGKGFYAIGVDMDQDALAPGSVLTSMVKHVDVAVMDTMVRLKNGQFDAGTHIYGLKDGGIGLSPMRYTKQDVPPGVLARLQTLTQMMENGTLKAPVTMQEAAAFHPPALPSS